MRQDPAGAALVERMHAGELLAEKRHLVRWCFVIVRIGAVEHVKAFSREPHHERRLVGRAGEGGGSRIEEPEPAETAAAALLVIAAHHDPGGGSKERLRRIEEIGLPGIPGVAIGTAAAAGPRGRAGRLAIEIIADMDDEIGLLGRGLGGDRGEGPGGWIVAILDEIALEPTARIADDDDAPDRRGQDRQAVPVELEIMRPLRQQGLAAHDRKGRVRGIAHSERQGFAVELGGGAGIAGDDAQRLGAAYELDPARDRGGTGFGGDGKKEKCCRYSRATRPDHVPPPSVPTPPASPPLLPYSNRCSKAGRRENVTVPPRCGC